MATTEIQTLSNRRSCPMWLFGEGSNQYDYKPMKLLEHVQKHTVTANPVLPTFSAGLIQHIIAGIAIADYGKFSKSNRSLSLLLARLFNFKSSRLIKFTSRSSI